MDTEDLKDLKEINYINKYQQDFAKSVELALKNAYNAKENIEKNKIFVKDKFKEFKGHLENAFNEISLTLNNAKEGYNEQLLHKRMVIEDVLTKSEENLDKLIKRLNELKEYKEQNIAIEDQLILLRKTVSSEVGKVAEVNSVVNEADLIVDYSGERLLALLHTFFKLNIKQETVNEPNYTLPRLEKTILRSIDKTIKASNEPLLLKFKWDTLQAECFNIKQSLNPRTNPFSTLTITKIISNNPSYTQIPKFSKTIITNTNKVYIIGGIKPNALTSINSLFELEDTQLIERASMLYGRYHHAAAYISNSIYVCGGSDQLSVLGSSERYDIIRDKWVELRRMVIGRSCHSLCMFGELLMFAIFGQGDDNKLLNTIERYEILNNLWQVLDVTPPNTLGGLKHKGSYMESKSWILIFGGTNHNNKYYKEVHLFNPISGGFKPSNELSHSTIFRNQPIWYNGKIYAYGDDDYVHSFDCKEQVWTHSYNKFT